MLVHFTRCCSLKIAEGDLSGLEPGPPQITPYNRTHWGICWGKGESRGAEMASVDRKWQGRESRKRWSFLFIGGLAHAPRESATPGQSTAAEVFCQDPEQATADA